MLFPYAFCFFATGGIATMALTAAPLLAMQAAVMPGDFTLLPCSSLSTMAASCGIENEDLYDAEICACCDYTTDLAAVYSTCGDYLSNSFTDGYGNPYAQMATYCSETVVCDFTLTGEDTVAATEDYTITSSWVPACDSMTDMLNELPESLSQSPVYERVSPYCCQTVAPYWRDSLDSVASACSESTDDESLTSLAGTYKSFCYDFRSVCSETTGVAESSAETDAEGSETTTMSETSSAKTQPAVTVTAPNGPPTGADNDSGALAKVVPTAILGLLGVIIAVSVM